MACQKRLGRGGKFGSGPPRNEPQRDIPTGMTTARYDDEHLRRLIADYFGAAARLRQLRAASAFGASVFVVDFDRGARHYRTLGSFGPSFGMANPEALQVTEQSSMDLLYPAQRSEERRVGKECRL